MQNFLKIFFLLITGVAALYYFLSHESPNRAVANAHLLCEDPLSYRIGHIDTRFGITEEEVKGVMETAVSIWSEAVDRPLAAYSGDGDIMVNFEYDERQEMVDGEFRFRERIESEQVLLNQFQREYDRIRGQFDEQSKEYVELAAKTTSELNRLNEWISERNDAGGFAQEDLEHFERRKAEIEIKQQQVLRERERLDRLAAQINQDTERLNQKVEENNRMIDQYNREFSGENRFTKATFQRTGGGGVITVNMFLSRQELYLILAHELGHAFGIQHVSNPRSVMYSQMGAQEIFPMVQLTHEDQQAIRNICAP